MTMIKWIRTSRLSIKNSLSLGFGVYRLLAVFDTIEDVPLLEQHRLYQLAVRPVGIAVFGFGF
jgi:hypothetical protein